ncbi:unnamed protein product [Trichogramma brassicae]|uniref:Reverse transcriptase zinc-binding domain-containing protein n=1 Tax=Trichogramma brassicae TaxID=86971 RepID=A0A6H5IKZ5_9HYME|nr:unnamed protein product [Trichogramma brassicae]
MPNTGGPRSSRRELYTHVIDSILLYEAPIWRCATETQAYIRQAEAVHRRACLRVIIRLLRCDVRDSQRTSADIEQVAGPMGPGLKGPMDTPANFITEWFERGHGEVDYYLTQLLSGHGYFKSHSQRYDNTLSALCMACPTTIDYAEHAFFRCL